MNFQEFDKAQRQIWELLLYFLVRIQRLSRPTEIFDGIVEPLARLSITERDVTRVVVLNIVYFHPYLRKWSNLTNFFRMGWNHQLDM